MSGRMFSWVAVRGPGVNRMCAFDGPTKKVWVTGISQELADNAPLTFELPPTAVVWIANITDLSVVGPVYEFTVFDRDDKAAPIIEPEDHIDLAQKFLHARRTLVWQRSFIDGVLLQLEVMKPDDALVALAVTRAELDMLCLGLQKLEAQYPKVTALRERLDILFRKASL